MNQVVHINQESQNLPATLDRIESAIALANKPEEINSVLALMDAAVAYAKRFYKDQADVIQRAKSLRLQAERRLGEILRDMPKHLGGRPADITGDTSEPVNSTTLADLGIDKRTSSRAQKLAALPEKTFAAVASGDMPVARAIATPRPAPKHTPVAEVRMRALKAAEQRSTSMLCTYIRLTLSILTAPHEFSEEEKQAIKSLKTEIDQLSI